MERSRIERPKRSHCSRSSSSPRLPLPLHRLLHLTRALCEMRWQRHGRNRSAKSSMSVSRIFFPGSPTDRGRYSSLSRLSFSPILVCSLYMEQTRRRSRPPSDKEQPRNTPFPAETFWFFGAGYSPHQPCLLSRRALLAPSLILGDSMRLFSGNKKLGGRIRNFRGRVASSFRTSNWGK